MVVADFHILLLLLVLRLHRLQLCLCGNDGGFLLIQALLHLLELPLVLLRLLDEVAGHDILL